MRPETRIGPKGRADYPTGGDEAIPKVPWQIPAVGNRDLDPSEAREFADYLEENSDEQWLQFILLGDSPEEVAEDLRAAADEAEEDKERVEERIAKQREELLED